MTSSKTGLLSAIVGAFIIEFYKKLSSDSGGQTVVLLQQISHQLPNSPDSTNSNTPNQPSSPGTAIVWVNTLWSISLVLSLTCVLIATLLQQWARRYTQAPKSTNFPRHRVRIRSLLLDGMKMYKILLIVEILPTLVHISVFLFLGGLVIAFHTIDKTVAFAVDVTVGVSGLAYIGLSILPCLDMKCPYRTPISKILWYPCHALLSLAALFLYKCLLGLHGLLDRQVLSDGQGILFRWLRSRGFSVSNHWRFLTDGLEKSIVDRAVAMLRDGDGGRVTWMFNQLALGDNDKFLKFAAIIPRYKIPDLIPPFESVSFQDFRESLLVLLRSCVANRPDTRHNPDVHTRALLLYLHVIRHIVKTNSPTFLDLNFICAHFANTGVMGPLWNDCYNSVRMTSRSICALVARRVVRKRRLEGAVLSWLQNVTGEFSQSFLKVDTTVRDQMNFKSFVKGALPPDTSGDLPFYDLSTEDTTTFNETLAILMGVRADDHRDDCDYFTSHKWHTLLSKEVGRIQRHDDQGGLEVFGKLRKVFPLLPPLTSAHAVIPSSSSYSIPPPSPVLPPSREVPPRAVHPRVPPSPRPFYPRAPSPHPGTLRTISPSHGAYRHHWYAPT